MGIRIESNKLSYAVKRSLEAGIRPDICIKTTGGCRIGLQNPFYRASPDLTNILNDPRVVYVSMMQYGRYCERESTPGGGQANYAIDFMATSAQNVLDNASRQCGEGRQCETCGGFQPPRGIADQFVEGLVTLFTSNPAILACLAVQGAACPLLALVPAQHKDLALQIFRAQGMVGLANKIGEVCRALRIPDSQCPAEFIANSLLGQQSPTWNPLPGKSGKTASIWMWLNNTLMSTLAAEQLQDGSWQVASFALPVIGGMANFTIDFSTCTLRLTSSNPMIPSGTYTGQMVGANKCQYAISNNKLVLALVEGSGTPLGPQDGSNKSTDDRIKAMMILGGVFLLGIILISQR